MTNIIMSNIYITCTLFISGPSLHSATTLYDAHACNLPCKCKYSCNDCGYIPRPNNCIMARCRTSTTIDEDIPYAHTTYTIIEISSEDSSDGHGSSSDRLPRNTIDNSCIIYTSPVEFIASTPERLQPTDNVNIIEISSDKSKLSPELFSDSDTHSILEYEDYINVDPIQSLSPHNIALDEANLVINGATPSPVGTQHVSDTISECNTDDLLDDIDAWIMSSQSIIQSLSPHKNVSECNTTDLLDEIDDCIKSSLSYAIK